MTSLPEHLSQFSRQYSGGAIRQHDPRHNAPLVADLDPRRQPEMTVYTLDIDASGEDIRGNDRFRQRRGRVMLGHQGFHFRGASDSLFDFTGIPVGRRETHPRIVNGEHFFPLKSKSPKKKRSEEKVDAA